MYSGLAISNRSGNIFGVHQKFNRLAYHYLKEVLAREEKLAFFPNLDLISHFEGKNGPDGLKIKSPGRDEPQHFYNPYKPEQTKLLVYLEHHFKQLKKSLAEKNCERAAYEAAWLSHVIVDGLTPAHHYPYEEKTHQLRGEEPGKQKKVLDKVLIRRKLSKNKDPAAKMSFMTVIDKNWSLWGAKGLILNHALFELGVALIVKPLSLKNGMPTSKDIRIYEERGLIKAFKEDALQIADHDIYHNFHHWGWTPTLALQVKNLVSPIIVKLIVLSWREAIWASSSPALKDNQHLKSKTSI